MPDITLSADIHTFLQAANNAAARSALGLGSIATQAASAVAITGGTVAGLTGLAIRDTSAALDVTLAAVSSTPLSAGRTLTLDIVNADRTIKLAGNLDLAGNLTTSGANALTLTTTGATNVTLPTSGTLAILAANTFTGQQIISLNGAASTPPLTLTGTWFSGGSATTTKPQLLVEPSGTTSTGWSTSGTGLGVNAASGFTGNLIDLQLDGVTKFTVSSAGTAAIPDSQRYRYDGQAGSYSARKGSTQGGGSIITECAGTDIFAVGQNSGVGTVNIGPYSFSTAISATADVFLYRDAAAVLALKNTTTAQTLRIYGNTTGSHYLNMTHDGTNAVLSVNGGGTLHISSLPTANPGAGILWNNAGTPAIGT